jgi:protein JSN1
LTLPSGGLPTAFGSSIFSPSWLSSTNGSGNCFPVLEELRSVASAESVGDDFEHTLNYLGLNDHEPSPAATISELRNQAQAVITGNLAGSHARLRARTVSNPYFAKPAPSSVLSTPAVEGEDEYFDAFAEHSYPRQRLNEYDSPPSETAFGTSSLMVKGFKHADHLSAPTRPRAISVGALADPMRSLQRRATAVDSYAYLNELPNSAVPTSSGLLKADKSSTTRGASSSSVHFPSGDISTNRGTPTHLAASTPQNRSVSPKLETPISQVQTPTRSLWIGNLDSAVTREQLIHVFAPYGAIESLRLLPEKECGFVNFVEQADAIRAKEDVLNRLGGNIGMPNGQTVRIGFGKADSAPIAPAKGNPPNSGPTSPNGAAGKSSGTNNGSNIMDAQLQATPTRALWIGSIPSTTTPATILSVFSPYGPIESARVLTHKNCGFINFERLDDAVRARKALNGRDVLGSDVGAIRIGFAKVPVKSNQDNGALSDESLNMPQGIGDLSVGATIHVLRTVKGASTIPADQQVLGGVVENYRSNLLLSMIGAGVHNIVYASDNIAKPPGWQQSITEQQMIMRELCGDINDVEADIQDLAEFRPPTMYYTSIPLVSERNHNRRWDAAKLRDLRKRLDAGNMSVDEVDLVAADFMDGEIVDLDSDWLGNTVVHKLFEKCSATPRISMLERIAPHLATIGIHKNGTWAAQKIIECVNTPEEISLIAQHLRPYAPPLLLDQFGNYVVQCCLRFGPTANDFIFDAIVDRMWEVAQGRFGARSMRACLESPHITPNQQRRIATAIILNSIPLATNPNGALLLTWLLDTSGFPSRYNLLAPRFTPHLSHLCTHKLASLTVLRIVNQKIEPNASKLIVDALFSSPGDHVLTDVLGDQVNGVAVVHKILTSAFIDQLEKHNYIEATKRVLIELKVIATQAYRRLIEEVGLPIPNYQPAYANGLPNTGKTKIQSSFGVPGLPSGYPSNDQGLASMMAALQMGGQNPQAGPTQIQIDSPFNANPNRRINNGMTTPYSHSDSFNPLLRPSDTPNPTRRSATLPTPGTVNVPNNTYKPPNLSQAGGIIGMGQSQPPYSNLAVPHLYQPYVYPPYPQNGPNMGPYPA